MSAHSGLAVDTRNRLDGVKEAFAFGTVFDVGVNEERVSFQMDVLHHDLEAVETVRFCRLNLV